MAVAYGAAGAIAYSTSNPAPAYPTGITAGQALFLIVGTKPDTTPATTPSGWTLLGAFAGGAGSTGIDTGPMRVGVFFKEADGSESGTQSVTVTGNNVSFAQIIRYTKAADELWDIGITGGADTAGGTAFSALLGTVSAGFIAVGDHLLIPTVFPTDTNPTWGTATLTAQGGGSITLGSASVVQTVTSSSGQDIGGRIVRYTPSASTQAAGTLTFAATLSGTTTNAAGPVALIRIRAVASGPPIEPPTNFTIEHNPVTLQPIFTWTEPATTPTANYKLYLAANNTSYPSSNGTQLGVAVIPPGTTTYTLPDDDSAEDGIWFRLVNGDATNTDATSPSSTPWTQSKPAVIATMTSGGTGNRTVTKHANVQDGDLLIAFHGGENGTAAALTAPAGWTLVDTSNNGTDAGNSKLFKKVASGEGASWVFGGDSTSDNVTCVVAVRGADTSTELVWARDTNTTHTAPSVTPTTPLDLLLAASFVPVNNVSISSTHPIGMTELADFMSGTWHNLSVASSQLFSGAPTGTQDFAPTNAGHRTRMQWTVAVPYPVSAPAFDPIVGSDSSSVAISESSSLVITATKAGADTSSIAIADVSSTARSSTHTDTGSLAIAETSALQKNITATDSTSVAMSESSSGQITATASDTSGLAIADASAVLATVGKSGTDSSSIAISETTVGQVTAVASDTSGLAIADTSAVHKTIVASDTSSIAIAESAAQASTLTSTDTSGIAISESASIAIADTKSASDSSGLAIAESITINSTQTRTDSGSLAISETASVAKSSATSDTSSIAISETAGVAKTITASDSGSLAIAETTAFTRNITSTDTTSLAINDVSAIESVHFKTAFDNGSLAIAESTSGAITATASDSSGIAIADSSSIFVARTGSDTASLAISETADAEIFGSIEKTGSDSSSLAISESSSRATSLSRTDTSSIAVSESQIIGRASSHTDSSSLSVAETSAVFKTLVASDSGSLAITEQQQRFVDKPASDSGALEIDETSSLVKELVGEDSSSIAIDETSSVFVSILTDDTDTLAIDESTEATLEFESTDTGSIAIDETSGIEEPSITLNVYFEGEWREGTMMYYKNGVWNAAIVNVESEGVWLS